MSLACSGAAKSALSATGPPISAATATARSALRQRLEATTGIPCVASNASAWGSGSQPPAGSQARNEAITARADVRRDPAKASEIWKATDDAWWQGPDDPNVCVLRVHPLTAELWDGPSSNAVAAFEFVKAQLTGEKPNLGENRKVTVSM